MTIYQQLIQKQLPDHTLILPLQYSLFGTCYHCVIFANVIKEIGKGASKRVDHAQVTEILGQVPLPEVASLKGQDIVLYRPRDNVQAFINDIIAIVKLNQVQLKEYNARGNIVKIKGHSLYITEEYQGTESDYTKILYDGYLRLTPDPPTLLAILQSALGNSYVPEDVRQITEEILNANDLVDCPFMIGEVLPFSIEEGFLQMDVETILQNIYQMIYTISAYAAEGIFFRDLQPDNFRVNTRQQIKLIDPSYLDASVQPDSRYVLFIKQTTPEYLPNVCSQLLAQNQQAQLQTYFGNFTEGVCIGMLERVLKRIFLPKYMSERYDNLYRLDPHARIEANNTNKFQEDADFFRDVLSGPPTTRHFSYYQGNLVYFMKREGLFCPELISAVAKILTILKQFSCPNFTNNGCYSLLNDEQGEPLVIQKLPSMIQSLLGLGPVVATMPLVDSSPRHRETIAPVKPNPATPQVGETWRMIPTTAKPSVVTRKLSQIPRSMRNERANTNKVEDVVFGEAVGAKENKATPGPESENQTKAHFSVDPETKMGQGTTEQTGASSSGTGTRKFKVSQGPFGAPTVIDDNKNAATPDVPAVTAEPINGEQWSTTTGKAKISKGLFMTPFAVDDKKSTPATDVPAATAEPTYGEQRSTTIGKAKISKGLFMTPFAVDDKKSTPTTDVPAATTESTGSEQRAAITGKAKFSKGLFATPFATDDKNNTATPDTAKESSRLREDTDAIMEFIESQELPAIKTLLRDSPVLVQLLHDNLAAHFQKYQSVEELKTFFKKANGLLQLQDSELTLLRQAQSLVADEIYKDLERHASVENKHHFRSPAIGPKCKKLLTSYLVHVAKTRFLANMSLKEELAAFLPKSGEDILKFICDYYCKQHSVFSPQELANTVANDLNKTVKRTL